MDYYLCYTLSDSFYKFQNGMPNNYKRTTGIKPIGINRL